MSSRFLKLLGVGVFAASLAAAYQVGRSGSGGEHASQTRPDMGMQSTSWEETGEESGSENSNSGPTASPNDLAPFETLMLDPSLPRAVFVNPETGEGTMSLVIVGAPGIWPPATRTTGRDGAMYLPDTDVETLRGQRIHHYEVMARSSGRSLAFWDSVSFELPTSSQGFPTRRLPMKPASPVGVQVVGDDGEPVQGAEIRLSRKRVGFVGLTKRTGPHGRAEFRAIPAGDYLVTADTTDQSESRTPITHEPPHETSLVLEGDSMPVKTSNRVSKQETKPERTGRPRQVVVRLDGLSAQKWREVDLQWRRSGEEWKPGVLRPGEETASRGWQRRLPPGNYQLRLVDAQGNTAQRRLTIEGSPDTHTWEVTLEEHFKVFVTDGSGQPIQGALVQVWRGERLVESRLSQGDTPLKFSLKAGTTHRLVAIDAARGETSQTIRPSQLDQRRLVLRVDQPLMSSNRPPDRVHRQARVEEILEVPIVRDGEAWLVDATDPESRAMQSGLQRADRLMSLYRVEEDWEVIVERNGQIVTTRLANKRAK